MFLTLAESQRYLGNHEIHDTSPTVSNRRRSFKNPSIKTRYRIIHKTSQKILRRSIQNVHVECNKRKLIASGAWGRPEHIHPRAQLRGHPLPRRLFRPARRTNRRPSALADGVLLPQKRRPLCSFALHQTIVLWRLSRARVTPGC